LIAYHTLKKEAYEKIAMENNNLSLDINLSNPENKMGPVRKVYTKPKLQDYGDIAEITKQGNAGTPVDTFLAGSYIHVL
jgi:hypothetical protein